MTAGLSDVLGGGGVCIMTIDEEGDVLGRRSDTWSSGKLKSRFLKEQSAAVFFLFRTFLLNSQSAGTIFRGG